MRSVHQRLWLGLGASVLFATIGCGSPWSETWEGSERSCSNSSGTSNSAADVELVLDGPVTLSPSGTWRISTGNGSWLEAPVNEGSYMGASLKFSTTYTVSFLGISASTITDYDLARTPGHLKGESKTRGDNSTTCQVDLTPKKK